jgi:hypothetical protein
MHSSYDSERLDKDRAIWAERFEVKRAERRSLLDFSFVGVTFPGKAISLPVA